MSDSARAKLESEAAKLYPLDHLNDWTQIRIAREKQAAHVRAKIMSADWKTIVGAMKAEAQEHHVEENLNLGRYKTKYVCYCGEVWVTDGHSAHPQWSFGDHLHETKARAAFRAAGFLVEGGDDE